MSLKYHAVVKLDLNSILLASPRLAIGLKNNGDNVITVKKDSINGLLTWRGYLIKPEWIKDVIEGDIVEYLL